MSDAYVIVEHGHVCTLRIFFALRARLAAPFEQACCQVPKNENRQRFSWVYRTLSLEEPPLLRLSLQVRKSSFVCSGITLALSIHRGSCSYGELAQRRTDFRWKATSWLLEPIPLREPSLFPGHCALPQPRRTHVLARAPPVLACLSHGGLGDIFVVHHCGATQVHGANAYEATQGWDPASGLGTPIFSCLRERALAAP
jgi:hypothetical protein